MVLLAATRIAEPFLMWHEWLPTGVFQAFQSFFEGLGQPLASPGEGLWMRTTNNALSIGFILLITMLYSTTGGLRSVVATDLVQFFVAIFASLIFAWLVVRQAGGMETLLETLRERYPGRETLGLNSEEILAFTPSRAREAGVFLLIAMGLQWLVQMNADGTGYLAQRSMACRTDRDARQAAVIFTFAQVVLRSLVWLPLALGLLVLFPPAAGLEGGALIADREFTFVRGIKELLPPGLTGLMLVGMIAALASTVDTHLNWGASYWTNDLYRRFFAQGLLRRDPSPRSLVLVARLANLLILAIALLVLPLLSSIQQAWQTSLLFGAGMGVVLVLRWVWWRMNAWGEFSCLVASAVLAPALLFFFPPEMEALRLLVMAAGTTLVSVAVALSTPATEMSRLTEFYRRVRPPGFWGPVARAAGEPVDRSRRRLWRGALATGTAAISIFCLLTGVGSWMVEAPPPVWFPWREAWISILLVLAAALTPVWWHFGFNAEQEKEAFA